MKLYRVLLTLMCLFLTSSIVLADSTSEVRKAIQARYDQFDKSYMKKDFKSVATIFGPECRMKLSSEGRSMTAQRAVHGMEVISKSLTITHAKTKVISVKAIKEGFEVKAVWTGDSDYKPISKSSEDKPRHSKSEQDYLDVWKKTDTGWQIIRRTIEG